MMPMSNFENRVKEDFKTLDELKNNFKDLVEVTDLTGEPFLAYTHNDNEMGTTHTSLYKIQEPPFRKRVYGWQIKSGWRNK